MPGADGRAGTVEQYPLVGLGDLEQLADLVGAVAEHVAQGEHDPLPLGQRVERGAELAAHLAGQHRALDGDLVRPGRGAARQWPG